MVQEVSDGSGGLRWFRRSLMVQEVSDGSGGLRFRPVPALLLPWWQLINRQVNKNTWFLQSESRVVMLDFYFPLSPR